MTFTRIFLFFLLFLVVGIGGASAGQYDYVVPPVELWSCFDYAMHYSKENPEWGMLLISDHPRFWGMGNSHYVNYQISKDKRLMIHDEMEKCEYYVIGWQYDSFVYEYYHFCINGENPTRNFKYKLPNAAAVYNAL